MRSVLRWCWDLFTLLSFCRLNPSKLWIAQRRSTFFAMSWPMSAAEMIGQTRLGLITSAAAVLAALGIYATPRLVLAQVQPARPAATPAPPATPPTPALPAQHVLAAPDAEAAEAAPVAAGPSGTDAGPRFK